MAARKSGTRMVWRASCQHSDRLGDWPVEGRLTLRKCVEPAMVVDAYTGSGEVKLGVGEKGCLGPATYW
jgi:hypothetical protein